ncbi:MAG: hypothetical protein QOE84_836 [Actinomycetota bacterium]|nr:hypothetical protein [Actinomycetota bacterium]
MQRRGGAGPGPRTVGPHFGAAARLASPGLDPRVPDRPGQAERQSLMGLPWQAPATDAEVNGRISSAAAGAVPQSGRGESDRGEGRLRSSAFPRRRPRQTAAGCDPCRVSVTIQGAVSATPRNARPSVRAGLGLLVAVLLLAAGWWFTNADSFSPVGNGLSVRKAAVGQPLLFGVFADPGGAVELGSATARVRTNTADATVRVIICRGARGSSPIGIERRPAAAACTSVGRPRGSLLGRVRGSRSPQLVVEVIPRRPGQVVIAGVHLSYRSGLRWGRNNTGPVITVVAQ